MKDLYTENYKALMKKLKKIQINVKIFHVTGLEESMLLTVVFGDRKGLAHENLRMLSLVQSGHLSASSSSCPLLPGSLTTPAHFGSPGSPEAQDARPLPQ